LRIGIIGAGAVGVSCALHLRRNGHDVTLFDRSGPGAGASLGNAGIIATSEVLPLGRPSVLRRVPRMLFDPLGPLSFRPQYLLQGAPWMLRLLQASRPQMQTHISSALASLLARSLGDWQDAVSGAPSQARLSAGGLLRLYETQSALDAAKPDLIRASQFGVRVELLSGAEAHALEPSLAPVFSGGALHPDVWRIDTPRRVIEEMVSRLVGPGCRIVGAQIARIESHDAHAALVEDGGARHRFDRIVLAAGAWSRQLLRQLGEDMPLDTERGYHVMLRTPPSTITRAVTVVSPGYTLSQMEGGLRLTTGVEFAGLEAPPDFRRIRRMVAHLANIIPGLRREPLSEWLGFRPSMPDSLPVVGPLRRHPRVVAAFGHGHLGLTLGPTTGLLVGCIVDGREPPISLNPFLPASRFN
jgi:D-amino-acid dehydrogenase